MFGLSMHGCKVSSINSHAEAVAFYNSCKVKRGHDHGDERPIRGKERSNMSVRITDNVVKFRYHNTDVVSWYPDNSFRIETWESNSTCEFARVFTPRGTSMTKQGQVLEHNDTYYPLRGSLTVHADGRVVQGYPGTCFSIVRTDRRKGKEALANTRYAEYRQWYNVMWPMVRDTAWLGYNWDVERFYEDYLADEDRWHDLMMTAIGDPNILRKLIYRDAADSPFHTEYADTLPGNTSWHTLSKWSVSVR